MKLAAVAVWAALGCQKSVSTPFPPGLEPLEDNIIAAQDTGPYAETLQTQTTDSDYFHIYGLGYVLVAPAGVWAASENPLAMVAVCSTTDQTITANNDPAYEFSFLVHYTVDDIITVEWDDQWRWGVIEGTDAAPTLGMIKHQKIDGSSLISLSEGTIQVLPTDDPNVTELSFVEHLEATGSSSDDVVANMNHNFAAIVAVAHGNPIPACP